MCNFTTKFGLVHQAAMASAPRGRQSVGSLREMIDLDTLEDVVFVPEVQKVFTMERTTLKLRNSKAHSSLTKLAEQLCEFQVNVRTVFLVSPNKGKSYAYVEFATEKDAEIFLQKIKSVAPLAGDTLMTGALGKRNAHFAKHQHEAEILEVLAESDLKHSIWRAVA